MKEFKLLSDAENKYIKGWYKGSNKNYNNVLRCRVNKKISNLMKLCYDLIYTENIDFKLIANIKSCNEMIDNALKHKYSHLFDKDKKY